MTISRDIAMSMKQYQLVKKISILWKLLYSVPEITLTVLTLLTVNTLVSYSKDANEEDKQQIVQELRHNINLILILALVAIILKAFTVYFVGGPIGMMSVLLFVQVAPFALAYGKFSDDYDRTVYDVKNVVIVSAAIQGILRIRLINCTVF
jgi:hypothetical protein